MTQTNPLPRPRNTRCAAAPPPRPHDVEIILPRGEPAAAARMIGDVFQAAGDLFPSAAYRIRVRHLGPAPTPPPAGWAPQTAVFLGGISSRWSIAPVEKPHLQRLCRQAGRCLFAGSAVFLLPAAGLSALPDAAVHANFSAAAREEQLACADPGTPASSKGGISTAVSGFAALRLLAEYLGEDHGGFAADAVCGYLGLTFAPEAQQSQVSLQLRQQACGDALVARTLELMQHHIEEPLMIRDVAREAGVSPRKLERRFQEKLATSPLTAYRKLRVEKARQLLLHSSLPLAEIAAATGFGSRSTLSNWFRREYQTSPQALRREYYADQPAQGSAA